MYFNYVEQPFVVPPEMRGRGDRQRVLIVGAGPVGLALALALARQGVHSVIIERRGTVAYGSRAICLSQRSLDILALLGVADRFVDKGYAWSSGRTYYRDRPVLDFEMPQAAGSVHPPMINLQQCYIEQFLFEAALETGLVDVRWHTSLIELRQEDDGVTVTVEAAQNRYAIAADYVVACDGARSAVRRALGLELRGTSYEGRYVIADIGMPGVREGRRVWFDPPSSPGSTVVMHCQPDDIIRVDYQLLDDEQDEAEMQETRVRERVGTHLDWIGETRPWELVWTSLYKAHSRTLDDYDHGRVLFAGDAAHLVPIFGVRGLNGGLEDVANLGWKLAAVLSRRASGALLRNYSHERVAAARENMRQAEKSAGFMTPPGSGHVLMRDAVLSLATSQGFVRDLINPRQVQPIRYLPVDPDRPSDAPYAGRPCPNVFVTRHAETQPVPLYALLGEGFSLIRFERADRERMDPSAEVRRVFVRAVGGTADDVTIIDTGHRLRDLLEAHEGDTLLIRPDGYVVDSYPADRAAEAQADLASYIDVRSVLEVS